MPQGTRRKFLIDAPAASLGIALATRPARASALNLCGRIFAAARKAPIMHCFVEQEAFDIPPHDALRIDVDYMRKFLF